MRLVTVALRMCLVSGAALSAVAIAPPVESASAAERVTYRAPVRVAGQVTVSFHGDPSAGCAAAFRCDVQGTIRWTPRAAGELSIVGVRGGRFSGYLSALGADETSVETLAVVERGAADGTHLCADARDRSDYSTLVTLPLRELRFGLQPRRGVFGPLSETPLGTQCGGPLPEDVLARLPSRTVSLRALLRAAPTTLDLSGSAPFAAGGLAGTVDSTVVVRVRKARVRRVELRRRSPRPRPSDRAPARTISVEYRLVQIIGSVPVELHGEPRTCAALDACGLSGTVTVTPGPARGEAYFSAYGRLSRTALRRAVGLAPGPPPRKASVYGYLAWTRARGTVAAALERGGEPACRDTSRLSEGAIEMRVRSRRITATFAGGAPFGATDVLRSRCPGPLFANLRRGTRLAVGRIPRSALGRRRLTLHLDRGATAVTPGYRLRSRPDLTVVLEREKVEERLLGEAFVDDGGGGGGGGGAG